MNDLSFRSCVPGWKSVNGRGYNSFLLIFAFFIPLLIMIITSVSKYRYLNKVTIRRYYQDKKDRLNLPLYRAMNFYYFLFLSIEFNWITRQGVDKVKPRYGLSTPYRLTNRYSAKLFQIVLFNMGDLHLVLTPLNLYTTWDFFLLDK